MEKGYLRADPLPIEALVDRVRRILEKEGKTTDFRLVIRNIDKVNHIVLFETSAARSLIGPAGATIEELEIDCGWKIRLDPWSMDQESMRERLSEMDGFIRIIGVRDKNVGDRRSIKCVIAEFQKKPKRTNRKRFELATGWDLELQGILGEESPKRAKLSFVEAKKILMMNYPEIKGIVLLHKTLLIYTTNVSRKEKNKFRTISSGWGVILKDAREMPQELLQKQTVILS